MGKIGLFRAYLGPILTQKPPILGQKALVFGQKALVFGQKRVFFGQKRGFRGYTVLGVRIGHYCYILSRNPLKRGQKGPILGQKGPVFGQNGGFLDMPNMPKQFLS